MFSARLMVRRKLNPKGEIILRKYLGSTITAYAAIIAPLIGVCLPLGLGILGLSAEISGATVFLTIACGVCIVVYGLYIKSISNQLYSWGLFSSNGVKIRTLFSKNNWMMYENCISCGIGFYTHGVLNSKAGSKVYFIFLSSDVFEESYRQKINLWKPSQTRIKVQFDKKLYDYLLTVLPKKQAKMLLGDYQKYFR